MKRKYTLGNCYRNALQYAMYEPEFNARTDVIVHGIAKGTGDDNRGKDIGHAWIERTEVIKTPWGVDASLVWVHDVASGGRHLKELFYAHGKVSYAVRYTLKQAIAQATRTRNYGPWDARIKKALHAGRVR